jgi:hypothetical protein
MLTRVALALALVPPSLFIACSGSGGGDAGGGMVPQATTGMGVAGSMDGTWEVVSVSTATNPPPTGSADLQFVDKGQLLVFFARTLITVGGQSAQTFEQPAQATLWSPTRDFFLNRAVGDIQEYALGETVRSDLFDIARLRVGMVAGTTGFARAAARVNIAADVQGWRLPSPDPSGTRTVNVVLKRVGAAAIGSEFGGVGGAPFVDPDPGERVTEIRIRHGSFVDAVQVFWETTNGVQHGANGGSLSVVKLATDEFITGIEGEFGAFVERLAIVTNKATYGPFGGTVGTGPFQRIPFAITVPTGFEVSGFRGRADAFVHSIGVMARER